MPVVSLYVNGQAVSHEVEARTLLVDFLRETLALTGTHVGCDTSQCGACVVHVGGKSLKSCAMLAAEAEGAEVTTIEGIATNGALHPMQEAFKEHHGLQCGFCTPGMVLSGLELVSPQPRPVGGRRAGVAGGQPLPLHRLPQHREGRAGGGLRNGGLSHGGERNRSRRTAEGRRPLPHGKGPLHR